MEWVTLKWVIPFSPKGLEWLSGSSIPCSDHWVTVSRRATCLQLEVQLELRRSRFPPPPGGGSSQPALSILRGLESKWWMLNFEGLGGEIHIITSVDPIGPNRRRVRLEGREIDST